MKKTKYLDRVLAPLISRYLFLEAAFMINWAFFWAEKNVKGEDKSISNGIPLPTDYRRPMKPFFIEIQIFWACHILGIYRNTINTC